MSDTPQAPDAPKAPRNWFLIASLALNLVVIAGIGSAMWRHSHGGHRFRGGPDGGLMSFTRQLPAERRQLLKSELMAERESIRPARQAVRTARQAVSDALAAEPFDRAKAEAASQSLLAAETQFKTKISQALINAAEKMTAEERRLWKEWRDKRQKHRRWGPGRRDKDEGPDGPAE